MATTTTVGQEIGAGNTPSAKSAATACVVLMVVACLVEALLLGLWYTELPSLWTQDPKVWVRDCHIEE